MSYTKNTWQTGDIITAEKLNNIESGVEASGAEPLIVHTEQQQYGTGIDVSFNDIATALRAKKLIYYFGDVDNSISYNILSTAYGDYTNNNYQVEFSSNLYVSTDPDEHMYSPG